MTDPGMQNNKYHAQSNLNMESLKLSHKESYSAEAVANTYNRAKAVLKSNILIAYGGAAAAICCNPDIHIAEMSYLMPNIYRIPVDNDYAKSKGLIIESISNRSIKFYDTIMSSDVTIGMNGARHKATVDAIESKIGAAPGSLARSFLGLNVNDIISYSKFVNVNGTKVLVPSAPNQVSMLYALWLSDSYGDVNGPHSNELREVFMHHFGSIPNFSKVSHSALGLGGEKYAELMKKDLHEIIRS